MSTLDGRAGTKTKGRKSKLPPIVTYAGKITRRADRRARIVLDRAADLDRLRAEPGTHLLLEADFSDGFEVVAAKIYAVHHEFHMVDVNLFADLPADAGVVKIYRSALGDAGVNLDPIGVDE